MAPVSMRPRGVSGELTATSASQSCSHARPDFFRAPRVAPTNGPRATQRRRVQTGLFSFVRVVARRAGLKPLVGRPFEHGSDAGSLGAGRFFESRFSGGGHTPAVDLVFGHALQCSATTAPGQPGAASSSYGDYRIVVSYFLSSVPKICSV
jgi:hypothetical protein